jgi:hypothetical protein
MGVSIPDVSGVTGGKSRCRQWWEDFKIASRSEIMKLKGSGRERYLRKKGTFHHEQDHAGFFSGCCN